MLKKILTMLILALTIQFNWTVASAYCLHETDKSASHFGHHPHQHDNAAQDDEKSPDSRQKATHADCDSCVHSAMTAMPWHAAVASPLPGLSHQLAFPLFTPPAPYMGMPDRPQWMALA
ncbi:hypothetical protein [Undibacterium sp. TJN19]|uniref:hypothetical protein n=1 Tax=Undibacterium sp. TJN19 TaxID=3413055 RepID=UPI003BF16441